MPDSCRHSMFCLVDFRSKGNRYYSFILLYLFSSRLEFPKEPSKYDIQVVGTSVDMSRRPSSSVFLKSLGWIRYFLKFLNEGELKNLHQSDCLVHNKKKIKFKTVILIIKSPPFFYLLKFFCFLVFFGGTFTKPFKLTSPGIS